MNKISTLLSIALLGAASISAQTTMKVLDATYNVDTLYHAQVGPGTTQTSLLLSGPGNLRVFYLTIDRTNPYVSFSAVCATDKLAGNETVSSMAKRKSDDTKTYFAGVNGDFFTTSGSASNGKSKVGTPTSACIVDGEVYKTSSKYFQFTFDNAGMPHIGTLDFTKSMAQIGDKSAHFKAVNVGGANNGITLYTPRYYGCADQASQAGNCSQVIATLVEGDTYSTLAPFRLKVESDPTDDGNLTMTGNQFVIHGRGTKVESGTSVSGIDFVKSLKPGDVVTFTPDINIDGKSIIPTQVVSGNPHTVGDGATLDTESTRGDASARHPRTGIGYGDNKNKIIMMVVDGRSNISQGVRTSELADIMRFAGATDAINLDGGGSSCLYTSAVGVRNEPSDGHERADGNGIYAVCNAPQDNEIVSIAFREWAMKFPQNGEYTPVVYGYNKYGMMVDDNITDFELSCPEQLGKIVDKTTFVGSGMGTYALTATYKGLKTTIPVTIVQATETSPRLSSIVYDGIRDYSIEVQAKMMDKMMKISPLAFTWSSNNENVLTIDSKIGKISAVANGEAEVQGVLNDNTIKVNVSVQKPTASVMPIDKDFEAGSWEVSASGAGNIVVVPFENGMKVTYTGASSRAPRITISKSLTLWSLPDKIRLRINPGEAQFKTIAISIASPVSATQLVNKTVTLTPSTENIVDYDLADIFDTSDLINYPIELKFISLYPSSIKSGENYTIEIPGVECIYNSFSSVEENKITGKTALSAYPNPVSAGEVVTITGLTDGKAEATVANMSGVVVANSTLFVENGKCMLLTDNLAKGMYIINIKNNEGSSSSIIAVK